MGKWDKLSKRLRALPPNPDYQLKVDEIKKEVKNLPAAELAKRLDRARRAKDKLKLRLDLINVDIEAGNQLLLAWMDAQDVTQIRTRSGVLFSKKVEPYASVEDQDALFTWIKETRSKFLLTVQWQRLNSYVKDLLEAGKNPPTGVKVYLETSIVRRGRSNHKETEDGE